MNRIFLIFIRKVLDESNGDDWVESLNLMFYYYYLRLYVSISFFLF